MNKLNNRTETNMNTSYFTISQVHFLLCLKSLTLTSSIDSKTLIENVKDKIHDKNLDDVAFHRVLPLPTPIPGILAALADPCRGSLRSRLQNYFQTVKANKILDTNPSSICFQR